MEPDSPVEIKKFDHEWQAEMARITLEGEGIFTIVKPAPSSYRLHSKPAILVRAEDAQRALDILRRLEAQAR